MSDFSHFILFFRKVITQWLVIYLQKEEKTFRFKFNYAYSAVTENRLQIRNIGTNYKDKLHNLQFCL